MGEKSFSEKILAEKLAKLNNSQQSIESLSKWCVHYRRKAKQVVELWEKTLKATTGERRVSLLYLSNDILQNSRRKGSEFVNEFWKVLPTALKDIYDSGDENGRKVTTRLIEIWEERKVFGSRGQNLKSDVMGHNAAPVSAVSNSNLIKIVKRDANSVRLKLSVGGLPEKIITAMHTVHHEIAKDETAVDKCHKAISSIQDIDKDAMNGSSQGKLNGSDVVQQVQEQEDVIQQAMTQFQKSAENRIALISQLREALQAEESKLETFRSERLAAQSQIEHASKIKLQLTSKSSTPITNHSTSQQATTTLPPTDSSTIISPSTNQDGANKSAAASMAAKLTASTSSAHMFTSILSSLAAEEAASKRAKTDHHHPPSSDAKIPPEGSDYPSYLFSSQQMTANVPLLQTNSSSSSQLQAPFLPPPLPTANQPIQLQPNMMGLPYNNYGAGHLYPPPPPPPPSSGFTIGFARPGPPPQQAPPSSGVGFYPQTHQPATQPAQRQ